MATPTFPPAIFPCGDCGVIMPAALGGGAPPGGPPGGAPPGGAPPGGGCCMGVGIGTGGVWAKDLFFVNYTLGGSSSEGAFRVLSPSDYRLDLRPRRFRRDMMLSSSGLSTDPLVAIALTPFGMVRCGSPKGELKPFYLAGVSIARFSHPERLSPRPVRSWF
jgi:hypothetical protein